MVEWVRVEFKETCDVAASLKTICAFANDIDNWGVGYIVIGVKEENGKPVFLLQGLLAEQMDGIQKDMLNKCKLIQPEYLSIVEAVDYQDEKFLVIWAPGGNSRPYSSPKTMNFVDLCKNMNIVSALPEYTKPKNVGLMFFSFEPDKFFPYAQIDVVEFPDGLGGDRSVTLDGLKHYQAYSRRYRNRRIGEFLKELHLTEGRNTGFRKIVNALTHNGSPMPVFETDEDRLSFVVLIFKHSDFENNGVGGSINGSINSDGFLENERKIIECIQENPSITRQQMIQQTGFSIRTGNTMMNHCGR